jgi:thiol-disulfide isomerase/thioredoxin
MDEAKMGDSIKAALGTVVVMNLWATWCPPCLAEMPEFARFYNETKRGDVTFISVSANAPETIAGEVKPFIEKKRLPFPVSVLAKTDPEAISKATGAEVSGSLPCTLIYDRKGKLQKMLEEPITFDSLMALVKPLL